jgi:peptidoglycan/LPS O-acetylase OafA/YrhL
LIAYRSDIDGLRAVAIVSVVLFHAFPTFLPGGFTGVDVFFVISGFLITRIILTDLDAGRFTFGDFWIRRARRILPALLFLLLAVTPAAFYVLLPDDLNEYGELLSHSVIFAANIFLSNEPGYFDPSSQHSPLLHLWSLAVEEQYYLIWPLLLVASARLISPRRLAAGLAVLFLLSLGFSEWATVHVPREAFYGLPSRAFELLTGAGLAALGTPRIGSRLAAELAGLAGLVSIVLAVTLIDEKTRFPGLTALIPCLGAALLIASGGAGVRTWAAKLLGSAPFVRIGKISYSWYLWHWPPLAFTRYIVERPPTGTELAICLVAGLAMAAISERFVERPFRRPVPVAQFRRSFLPAAVAGSLALLGLGTAFQVLDGIPSRMGPEEAALYKQFEYQGALGCVEPIRSENGFTQCGFGASGPDQPTILLWGDSHAGHYLPAIAKLAAAQDAKGIARIRMGCLPLIRVGKKGDWHLLCEKSNAEALAELRARPEISVVVLAGRWSTEPSAAPEPERRASFRTRLDETVSALEGMGKTVILLGQVPKLQFSPKNCLLKKFRFGVDLPDCTQVPLASLNGYQRDIWTMMSDLARSHPSVVMFSPHKYMCDGAVCRATDDQRNPLYRDDHHLNARGAYFLEPHVREVIAQHLGRLASRPVRAKFR